jgi:HK97 family phage major capsid protein
LTVAEKDQFEALQKSFDGAKDTLDKEEKLKQNADVLRTPAGPDNGPRIEIGNGPERKAGGRKFADLFGNSTDRGGFDSWADFVSTIRSGRADDRLTRIQNAASENAPHEGGFAVPPQFTQAILDNALETEIVRPRAAVHAMSSNEKHVPIFELYDTQSSIYGFSATWSPELSEGSVQTPQMRKMLLQAVKLMLLSEASNELLADSLGFNEALQQAMVKALSWTLDDSFLNGSGAGQPLGILNSPAVIEVAKESGQGADTIVYENVVKMMSRLLPGSLNRAVWIASETCMPELMQMGLSLANGVLPTPILTRNGEEWSMHGIPVLFTEKAPTLGSAGDLLLADLSYYAIGLRKELSIAKSNAPGFTTDSEYFRLVSRVAGQPSIGQAITRHHGGTVSPFVVLADR